MYQIKTKRGYNLLEVSSALQKSIRRGDAKLAGYFAVELFESNFAEYAWRRLLTISAEDCWGVITHEIESLYRSWQVINKHKKGRGRIFLAKATILLAMARKCRDADHLTNLVYDQKNINDDDVNSILSECSDVSGIEIPQYAYDVHTAFGKANSKTKADFFRDEQAALLPREAGLFDDLINPAT